MIADARQRTRHSGPKTKKRSPAPQRSAKWLPKSPRDRFLVASGAAALFALLLCGVLFSMRTPDGTLVVEISDPEATVQVLDARGKLLIEQKAGTEKVEISVVPGKGKLCVVKNGVKLLTKEFSLVSGGRETINARLIPPPEPKPQVSNLKPPIAPPAAVPSAPEKTVPETPVASDPDRRAAEWAIGIGGCVDIESEGVSRGAKTLDALPASHFQVTRVDLWGNAKVTDEGVKNLVGLRYIKFLCLSGTKISDKTAASLEGLTTLTGMDLGGAGFTDAGFQRLGRLTAIDLLQAGGVKVSGAVAVSTLHNMTKLRELDISAALSDRDMSSLVEDHKNLVRLVLSGAIKDATLVHLLRLPELSNLYLLNAGVTDAGLKVLMKHERLTSLRVSGCPITDDGLLCVGRSLKGLDLTGTPITDAGLEHLQKLPNLKDLTVADTKVTGKGLLRLHESLPACTFRRPVSFEGVQRVAQGQPCPRQPYAGGKAQGRKIASERSAQRGVTEWCRRITCVSSG